MTRKELRIGQRVWITPIHTNRKKKAPKKTLMYVRELHNETTAGLSRKKTGKTGIYGILYEIIHPMKKDKLKYKTK